MLGLSGDASDEEIARAYRELAKQHHPDIARQVDAGGEMMRLINQAYAELRGRDRSAARGSGAGRPRRGRSRPAGWWLPAAVRRAVGTELLRRMTPHEPVLVVADAATWDAFHVRLVVTDRRLLWLRDDAPTDRVRVLPLAAIARVEGRLKRPRRRVGELRVEPCEGRRLSFSEIEPGALRALLLALGPRVRGDATPR